MACEYFSKQNGKAFCKIYGVLEATQDKIRECQSDFYRCHQEANKFLKDETRKRLRSIESSLPLAIFNRRYNSIF